MNVVLTLGRSAPPGSASVYLDFKRLEVSRGRERVRLWPSAFKMVAAILVSPHRLTTKELAWIAYEDRSDGGPDYATNCVWHGLWHARHRLKPLGIGFDGRRWGGYEPIDLWAPQEPPETPKPRKRYQPLARRRYRL